ncbi:protein serine/threonine phosphatase 2C, partial [Fistulina hepatica ATCC 64428]
TFSLGVSEDRGPRRTMEDAHSFVVDFDAVRGQGFFAVFDGHAGKHAAEWCGQHFHEEMLKSLHKNPEVPIPDVFNVTFNTVDYALSRLSEESDGKMHSGCTAVCAFLRLEDGDGKQSFLDNPVTPPPESSRSSKEFDESGSGSESALRSLGSGTFPLSPSSSTSRVNNDQPPSKSPPNEPVPVRFPPDTVRKVLYSANVGDARGVLCRGGKAVRLTYDHKGSDKYEAKRIMDAGGFVMSGRVNGVLAVTRSLGDSSMKEFVVGAPYTTETEICDDDEFLILACDGLWDIASDQAAVDLVRDMDDAQAMSKKLVNHASSHRTSDNVTVLVVRFKNETPKTA